MKSKPTIVITGASGFIGSGLTKYFSDKGWQVRALVRNPAANKPLPRVDYLAYDLGDKPSDDIFQGADYLVHAAYVKQDRQNPDALTTNIEGTKRLLASSRKHKLQKTIFLSSMSAHDEAISTYGKQKYQLEQSFTGPQDVVLRLGLVLGDGGLIRQITQFMRSKHAVPLIDGGDQPLQVLADYDLPRVIEKCLAPDIHGTFLIGTPEVYGYREFYNLVRRKLGIKAVLVPVPFIVPLYAIRLINALHLPLQITEDNLWGLKKLRSFDSLPDLQKLGVELDELTEILDKMNQKAKK